MRTKNLPASLFLIFLMTMTVLGCQSSYDEGSAEGHYDTVQNRTNDHTMTKQQHDGLDQAKADTVNVDSTAQH